MQYRDYGNEGYKVSAFGMGCTRVPHVRMSMAVTR